MHCLCNSWFSYCTRKKMKNVKRQQQLTIKESWMQMYVEHMQKIRTTIYCSKSFAAILYSYFDSCSGIQNGHARERDSEQKLWRSNHSVFECIVQQQKIVQRRRRRRLRRNSTEKKTEKKAEKNQYVCVETPNTEGNEENEQKYVGQPLV